MSVQDFPFWRRLALSVSGILIVSPLLLHWTPFQSRLLAQARTASLNMTSAKPEDNRFTVVPLIPYGELDEGLAFSVARDGRVFVIERRLGNLKVYDPLSASTRLVATFPVNHTYTSAAGKSTEAEEGLIGFTLDPNFDRNHFAYILYADAEVTRHVLARIELRDETDASGVRLTKMVPNSQKTVLDYGTQREVCCHTGGGMTWDASGNLYVTVGNNTGENDASQTDERPGKVNWDDGRAAANTNDLRGKILRIHPEADGSVHDSQGQSLSPGHAEDTAGDLHHGKPESLASVDRQRDGIPVLGRGRTGHSGRQRAGSAELRRIQSSPRGRLLRLAVLRRREPRLSLLGLRQRPSTSAEGSTPSDEHLSQQQRPHRLAAYSGPAHRVSAHSVGQVPEFGAGGSCAVGGPIYRRADFAAAAPRPWPAYYEGKWLITDCARGWIFAVTMDADGRYVSMERVLPKVKFAEPIDMKFGPDGDLYLLDYGSTWFAKSADARLVRVEYHAGNRPPRAVASASTTGGTPPFQVALSSAGSKDFDGDTLRYEWAITSSGGGAPRIVRQPNPAITFDRSGAYTVTLTVTDPSGARDTASVDVIAGNEPPADRREDGRSQ